MSKLFRVLAVESSIPSIEAEELMGLTFHEELDLGDSSEATEMAIEQLQSVQGMLGHMESQKLCSAAYLASMESYSPLVRSLGTRLGVRHLPSMEDFKNPHAAQASHAFAMEGFKDMVSKAWEKVKAFFRSFFKKIALFLKRIVKANLDLESYETYCAQLIAKLNAQKATITDNTTMHSELPVLLAGRGDRQIDSDYVLNQGTQKVNNLLDKLRDISLQGGGALLQEGLVQCRAGLKGFIELNKASPQSDEEFDKNVEALKRKGFDLISKLFTHQLNDPKNIPDKAYESLLHYYDSKDIRDAGFAVLSIADPQDPYRELPQGVNLFLSHVHGSNFFICSSKEEPPMVAKTLTPIAQLGNLVQFHKNYKNTLGALNFKGLDRNAEVIASEVDNILGLLHHDFGALMVENRTLRKSYTPEFLMDALAKVKKSKGNDGDEDLLTLFGSLDEEMDRQRLGRSVVGDMTTVLMDCFRAAGGSESNINNAVLALKKLLPQAQKALAFFIESYLVFNSDLLSDVQGVEAGESRLAKLQDLNRFLVNLFSRLQSLYKGIMTDFYGVLTALRYATIKYIYDSAKRYSY